MKKPKGKYAWTATVGEKGQIGNSQTGTGHI